MSKFRLNKNSVFSIGGNAITCITDVTFDEAVDTYVSECEDADGVKPQIDGGIVVSGSLTYEIEADGVTVLNYLEPFDSGAWIFQPNGTTATHLKITSTNIQISGRSISTSRTGLTTGTASFVCDNLVVTSN